MNLRKEIDVYRNHVELFSQSVPRPLNIGVWDWQVTWSAKTRSILDLIKPEVYMDHVILFGVTVFRPARIARSQWYEMWGSENEPVGWSSVWA